MHSLIWRSVTWTPGKPSIPPRIETNQQLAQAVPGRQRAFEKRARRCERSYGRATPSLRSAPIGVLSLDSCWTLILIVARQPPVLYEAIVHRREIRLIQRRIAGDGNPAQGIRLRTKLRLIVFFAAQKIQDRRLARGHRLKVERNGAA
jgi:hypothetical protein